MPTINLRTSSTRVTVQEDELQASSSTMSTDLKVNTIVSIVLRQINELVKSLVFPGGSFIVSFHKIISPEISLNSIASTIVFTMRKTYIFIKNSLEEDSRVLNISTVAPKMNVLKYSLLRGLLQTKLVIKNNTIKLNANPKALYFGLLSDYDANILEELDGNTLGGMDYKEA